jgi:hypothetical protein
MDALQAGIENMLRHCGGLVPGQSLLVLTEGDDDSHYDPGLAPAVAETARAMGLAVTLRELPFSPRPLPPSPEVMAAMAAADTALFLARRGDQLRFDAVLAATRPVMCYALDRGMMASPFGRADHRGLLALLALVNRALAQARHIRVTCPLGTDFEGPGAAFPAKAGEVTVRRFPLSVFSPVPAQGYRGTIALAGFLTGTGKTYYQPYDLPLQDVLRVQFDGHRITGFAGPDAAAAQAHYARVAALLGLDAGFIHSWHAGIHPGCAYLPEAAQDIARWGCGAFGNPRVLHFHSCGAEPPGEISLNVIDPTIALDGVPVWQDGQLHPERMDGGTELLAAYPCLAAACTDPARAVGLSPLGRLSAAPQPAARQAL